MLRISRWAYRSATLLKIFPIGANKQHMKRKTRKRQLYEECFVCCHLSKVLHALHCLLSTLHEQTKVYLLQQCPDDISDKKISTIPVRHETTFADGVSPKMPLNSQKHGQYSFLLVPTLVYESLVLYLHRCISTVVFQMLPK